MDAIIAKHEEEAINNFLKENKIDIFLKLNNVTLREYQEFLVLNETRYKDMMKQMLETTTTTPTTTDNTTLTTTNNNQTENVNTTTTTLNTTTSNISATFTTATTTHTNRSHNNTTSVTTLNTTFSNVSIGMTYNTTNVTTTTITPPKTTKDPFSKWAEKNWTFPENWTEFDDNLAAENQSSPSWYVRNGTFPTIDEVLILNTIDYEAILTNKTKVIEHMRKVNWFGK